MTNQNTKRKSFILHQDSLEILNELTDDQAGKLFKAIFSYQKTGSFGNVDQFIKIILTPFISQFKRDNESHENSIIQGKLGNLKKYHIEIYQKVINQEITLEDGEKLAYPEKLIKLGLHRPPITPDQMGSLNVNVSVNASVNKNANRNISKKLFSQDVEQLTDGLKFVLEAKLNRKLNTSSWKKQINLLVEKDLSGRPNAVDDVKRVIQEIGNRSGEQYFPVIESAASLREKFSKVEAAIQRTSGMTKGEQTIKAIMEDF
jgi:hypothetical protein